MDRNNPVENATNRPIRLIDIRQVQDMLGCRRSKIYEDIRNKKFCQPVKVGKLTRFVEAEVTDFIMQRVAERDAKAA